MLGGGVRGFRASRERSNSHRELGGSCRVRHRDMSGE